jgi:hypothetical protein
METTFTNTTPSFSIEKNIEKEKPRIASQKKRGQVPIRWFLSFLLFFLLFTGKTSGQSANCNLTGSLIENGSFENSNLNNWSAASAAGINFDSGLDDCGNISLRISRSSGSGLLDPAIWQQENNIQAGKIYTLNFDAATQDPSKLHRLYLRFYNSSGALLSQDYLEVNHDKDSDNSLKSYSFSMVAPAGSSYVRVAVALDGDKLWLDNVCLKKIACAAPTLNMQSPVLLTGIYGANGSTYRLLNAFDGIDAILTIVSRSHSDIVIESLDEPAATNGGYDWAFQPIIDYNWYNGGGPNDPAGEKSVTFKFDFIDANTDLPATMPLLNMTAVDVDGDGFYIREFMQASNFQSYEIQSPTELTLSGSLKAKGAYPAHNGVVETALSTMISYIYENASSVTVTYGGDYNGGNGVGDVGESRMNCLFFKCYDFNTSVVCPSVTVSGGNSICAGSPITLNASNTSGSGTCSLQWQSSPDGVNWTDINGAAASSYTATGLTATTHFRAAFACSGVSECGTVFSNVETVTVLATCAEICNNNIDDDGDGFIDGFDSDCVNAVNCENIPGQNNISGVVFYDANNNQGYDNGEYASPGVSVSLYEDKNNNGVINQTDPLVGSAVTGVNGSYSFTVNPVFQSTYDARINNACNDAKDGNETENKLQFGKDKDIGLRFTGISIPAGATITSAYLYFVSNTNQSKSGSVDIYAHNKKSPETFCFNNDVNSRIRTTTSVSWSMGNWVQNQTYQSKDVKSIVQELINSYGSYSNGDMAFIMISDGEDNVEAKSFETNGNSTQAPRLVIQYTSNTPVQYLVKIDATTLPTGAILTTPNVVSSTFTASGITDCNNNFGFTGTFEICNNGIDDDLDGFTDNADADCFIVPSCINIPGQNDITGTVFQDTDRNQALGNGDQTHAGATVNLYRDNNANGQVDAGEAQLQVAVSDANGYYSFTVNPVFTENYDARINLGCNDGRDGNNSENRIQFGKDKDIGLRFTGINIPAGSVINSAYLSFVAKTNQSNSGAVTIYANKTAAPVDFCANSQVTSRPRTTASVNWPVGNWVTGTEYQSVDVKSVIQELVNSYGAYSNGSMAFIMISTGANNVEAMTFETNGNSTQAPRLIINYTPYPSIAYVVKIDETTLPPDMEMTTPNVATAVFTASGAADCYNNFGFASTVEICNNGIDDDGDGLLDCADPECSNGLTATASVAGGLSCPGNNVTLSATGSGGVAPYSFQWSDGLGAGSSKTVNPLASSTYTVTLTAANGCTATGLVTVEVQSCPEICNNGIDDDLDGLADCADPDCGGQAVVSITPGNSAVCNGQSVTLTASVGGATGPFTYAWSNGLGNGSAKSVSPSTTTSYTVTVTSFAGCTATGQTTVTVNQVPVPNAGADVSICAGTQVNLAASATGGISPCTYDWNNGLGAGAAKSVTPLTTTAYTVTVTNASGCTGTDQVVVNVSQVPVADAGVDVTICKNFSATLVASATGGTSPYTYNWSNGLGSGASKIVTPTATQTYTVTVTSANGCISIDQVTVTVQLCAENCSNGLDDDGDGLADCADSDCGPTVSLGTNISICAGNPATLFASVAGGSGAMTYSWSNGLGSGPSKTVSPTATTTYSVTVTAESGCTATSQVVVTVAPCAENCTNGLDDDGDGLIDCADPDCSGVTAPVLADDNYSTCPGLPFTERVTYNDNNLQNPVFKIKVQPMYGTVNIDATGKFFYMPNGTDCTTDLFIYETCNQTTGCCAEATVSISMVDNTPPVLNNVPADLTIGCDDAVPPPGFVSAFDQCPGIYVDYDEFSSQNFLGACESYTITRTWTATDLCGNSVSDHQQIVILDQTKPEIFQVYTLDNSTRTVAGVAKRVTHDWKYVKFPITFSQPPVVLTQVTSTNDLAPIVVKLRNVSTQGFEMRVKEEEASDGVHAGENVSWVAIEPGKMGGSFTCEAGTVTGVTHLSKTLNFTQAFTNPPLFFSAVQTASEMDPATVRHTSISNTSAQFFLQEETSKDAETAHAAEKLGFLAIKPGSVLTDKKGNTFGETGVVNLTNAWASVTLARKYTKPVVIIGGLTNGDTDPVTTRVRNVTQNSFEVSLQEWNYQNGSHGVELVSWIVAEGSIPGNGSFYCAGGINDLHPGLNVFAVDNCDELVAFGSEASESLTSDGLLTTLTWMAFDDCGNVNLVTRYDTCATAAVKVKAQLYGPLVGNGNTGLMRDDLRRNNLVPVFEPFSTLPGFPHVNNNSVNYVTICHDAGTPNQITMTVPEQMLQSHLDHGDVIGACNNSVNNSGLPAAAQSANYRTIADGNWTDPGIWMGGNVPPTVNIGNKTISIEHQVVYPTGNMNLNAGAKIWVTNGSLTISNGYVYIQSSAGMWLANSALELATGTFEMWTGESVVEMKNCNVNMASHFINWSGKLKMEDVCLNVAGEFINNQTGIDTLINVTAEVGTKFANRSGAKMYMKNVKIRLSNGNFTNELLSTISGDSLVVWVENGDILNLGVWTAPITQYCISGTALNMGSIFPVLENCGGMPNYFSSGNCLLGGGASLPNGSNSLISDEEIAGLGTIDPVMLTAEGDQAVVDWLLVELRDAADDKKIVGYATAILQRDGSIVSEDGDPVLVFPGLIEGDYYVTVRHRNHLGLMTDTPVFLSSENPAMVDFTNVATPVRGGSVAGRFFSGKRAMWAGDFNEDGKVVYQGPFNDVFYLFSRVLADPGNTQNLANFIINGYELQDLNLDGKVIYQGPNNDRATLLYHTVLVHPSNAALLANFIVTEKLP